MSNQILVCKCLQFLVSILCEVRAVNPFCLWRMTTAQRLDDFPNSLPLTVTNCWAVFNGGAALI